MKNANLIWIASYPRSGNTFLRTILWQCFGLPSASAYKNDLGGNKLLEEYIGHIEYGPDMQKRLQEHNCPLVKTHEYDKDNYPAIYVIRDGRAACVSLWKFYSRSLPLKDIIDGRHPFGTWSNHIQSWDPWNRPNTLLLEYEDMRSDLPTVLNSISEYLKRDVIRDNVPERKTIAGVDGRWVRNKKNWTSVLSGDLLKYFNQTNKETLIKAGYLD